MYAKNFLDNMKSTSSQSTTQVMTDKTKSAGMSAAIGAGIGLVIAYQREKSLIMGAFLGALGGAIVSSFFIEKQFSNN